MNKVGKGRGWQLHPAMTELGEALTGPNGVCVANAMCSRMRRGRKQLANAAGASDALHEDFTDILAAIDLAIVILEDFINQERTPYDQR